MKRFPLFWALLPIMATTASVASAQAMVENALGAGRAATSAAPMRGLGSSIGGAIGGLEKTLKKSLDSTDLRPAAPARTVTALVITPVTPARTYENPNQIETGTAYDELVKRFGPASLEITTGPLTKTLSYVNREGAVQVELRDGRVTGAAVASALRR